MPNVWEQDTINFGSVDDYYIAPDRALGVKVIVDDAIGNQDMWFAYDTTNEASHLDYMRRDSLVVTNTLDDFTVGSLRWAIDQANTTAGLDLIQFDIGSASHTINVGSTLDITDSVVIDAESEPDFTGTPLVVLDGSLAFGDGINLTANDSLIVGLAITNFGNDGISISGSDNTILRNYFGTDDTMSLGLGNLDDGVAINGSRNQIINNVISGNLDNGITLPAA